MTCVPICRMIDAEMYGMMPSAKIDKRSSAPPENMLNMLQDRAGLLLEELLRAATGSMPGTGMNVPMR